MKFLRKNKKGFTLIEIIVVLVILAILAAALIPSMIGFVNDARGKALVAEARTVFVAGQAIASELTATATGTGTNGVCVEADLEKDGYAAINKLTAPDITVAGAETATAGFPKFTINSGVVKILKYKKIAGGKTYTITLESGQGAKVDVP